MNEKRLKEILETLRKTDDYELFADAFDELKDYPFDETIKIHAEISEKMLEMLSKAPNPVFGGSKYRPSTPPKDFFY